MRGRRKRKRTEQSLEAKKVVRFMRSKRKVSILQYMPCISNINASIVIHFKEYILSECY